MKNSLAGVLKFIIKLHIIHVYVKGVKQNSLGNQIFMKLEHCHEPDVSTLIWHQQRNRAKELVKSVDYPKLRAIHNQATAEISQDPSFSRNEIAASLQPFRSLQTTLNRVKYEEFGTLPTTLHLMHSTPS